MSTVRVLTICLLMTALSSIPCNAENYADLAPIPQSYSDLASVPVGSILKARGKVVQAIHETHGSTLRIATKFESGYNREIIWVEYLPFVSSWGERSEHILENDIVDVRGRFMGVKSYKSTLGNTIEIPQIAACEVIVVRPDGPQFIRAPGVPCNP